MARRGRIDVIESIAVVPRLQPTDSVGVGELAQALAMALTNSLAQLPKVRVVPRQQAFAAGSTLGDPLAIAKQLGAHAVLLIQIEPAADRQRWSCNSSTPSTARKSGQGIH